MLLKSFQASSSTIIQDQKQAEKLDLDTRKVLFQKVEKDSKDIYYIPGFMRIKVKNSTEMSLENLNAQMNATIIFSVYYGQIPQEIVDQLEKNIILLFGRDDAIKLADEDNLETKIKIHHSQTFPPQNSKRCFLTPFEIINLILSVTVQPVVTKWGTVKINLLDHQKNISKISYTEEGVFGNYDLAENLMRAQYTNDRVYKLDNKKQKIDKHSSNEKKKQQLPQQTFESKYKFENKMKSTPTKEKDDKKVQHFQYAHFKVPLYKIPQVALTTIFIPLQFLAIINLAIFFQNNDLADRIASIATLMIAIVALIPTIRDELPPNPTIVFVEILVYLVTFTSFLTLIHSMTIRDEDIYDMVWYQNGLFMASFIVTLFVFFSVLVMWILHRLVWLPSYNSDVQEDPEFKRQQWKNQKCDKYFNQQFKEDPESKKQLEDHSKSQLKNPQKALDKIIHIIRKVKIQI